MFLLIKQGENIVGILDKMREVGENNQRKMEMREAKRAYRRVRLDASKDTNVAFVTIMAAVAFGRDNLDGILDAMRELFENDGFVVADFDAKPQENKHMTNLADKNSRTYSVKITYSSK